MSDRLTPEKARAAFNLFSDMRQERPVKRFDHWADDGLDGVELHISEFATLMYYPPETDCAGFFISFEGSDNIYRVNDVILGGVLNRMDRVVYTSLTIRFDDMAELVVPTSYDPTREVTA